MKYNPAYMFTELTVKILVHIIPPLRSRKYVFRIAESRPKIIFILKTAYIFDPENKLLISFDRNVILNTALTSGQWRRFFFFCAIVFMETRVISKLKNGNKNSKKF